MDKLIKPIDDSPTCSQCSAPLNGAEGHDRAAPSTGRLGQLDKSDLDQIVETATDASNFLKAVSHEGRLMILCHLVSGEKSVTELEELLMARQAAVSQQLSRLRLEGLVIPRRDGKAIYYRLADDKPRRMLELVYDLFCSEDASAK